MIDYYDYWLVFVVEVYGVEVINFDEVDDFVGYIIEQMQFCGVDVLIDVVGFEVKGNVVEMVFINLKFEGLSGEVLCQVIVVIWCGGCVSVFGVYVGFVYVFLFGDVFEKGLIFKMG